MASGPIDVLVNNAGLRPVKLVEPGYGPTTRFTQNGEARMQGLVSDPYAPFAQSIFAAMTQVSAVTTELDVAQAVWLAANDTSSRLHCPAGADAVALAGGRVHSATSRGRLLQLRL